MVRAWRYLETVYTFCGTCRFSSILALLLVNLGVCRGLTRAGSLLAVEDWIFHTELLPQSIT